MIQKQNEAAMEIILTMRSMYFPQQLRQCLWNGDQNEKGQKDKEFWECHKKIWEFIYFLYPGGSAGTRIFVFADVWIDYGF